MGPLATRKDREAAMKAQRETLKLLNDEARKDQLHKLKVAKEVAKAESEEIPLMQTAKKLLAPLFGGFERHNPPPMPYMIKQGDIQSANMTMDPIPTNPEAGPDDTVPALLAPGEAVIPAPAAQDPNNKPIIEDMVNQGRAMNATNVPLGDGGVARAREALMGRKAVIDSASGFSQGTTEVKKPEQPAAPPLGWGMAEAAKKKLQGRKKQLEEQERKAMGFQQGTTKVGKDETPDQEAFKPGDRESFSRFVEPFVAPYAESKGISPSLLINQLGLESGWGKSPVGDYNFGNIKDFKGREGSKKAYDKIEKSNDAYRSYNKPEEFFQDYFRVLDQWDISGAKTNAELAQRLTSGERKYATDPNYVTKMGQFDKGTGEQPVDPSEAARRAAATDPRFLIPLPESSVPIPDSRNFSPDELADIERRRAAVAKVNAKRPLAIGTTDVPGSGWGEVLPLPSSLMSAEGFTPQAAGVPNPEDMIEIKDPVPRDIPTVVTDQGDPAAGIEAAALEASINDPEVQKQLAALEASTADIIRDDSIAPAYKENIIADGLKSIFGGLFSGEDLTRFVLLAAGGLVTGGSVGGSLRYAGLKALEYSDARKAAEAKVAAEQAKFQRDQAVEARKNMRERVETLENTYQASLKKATPEAQAAAQQLFYEARKQRDPRAREVYMQAAIEKLNLDQERTEGKVTYRPLVDTSSGKRYDMGFIAEDGTAMVKVGQKVVPMEGNFITESDWNVRVENIRSSVDRRITGTLEQLALSNPKLVKDVKLESLAKKMTEGALGARADLGFALNEEQFGQVVETALEMMLEEHRGDFKKAANPEAIRRTMLGAAVYASRQSKPELYSVPDEEEGGMKRASTTALGNHAEQLQRELEKFNKRRQDEGKEPISLGMLAAESEQEFEDFKKKNPEGYRKLQGHVKGKPGYSDYLLWVEKGRKMDYK